MQKRTSPTPSLAPSHSKKSGLHRVNSKLVDEITARIYLRLQFELRIEQERLRRRL
ncbi:MAG: hypothetical protein AB8G95_14305 [Anaerolineae bacterium]